MTLTDLIENTKSLPPAPEILPKLVALIKDPDADANDVVTLVQTDPAIVASLLKLSNSSAYAPSTPIADLKEAVNLLGIKEVYRIVNLITSGDFLSGSLAAMDIGKGGLWEHSLAVALILDKIATNVIEADGLAYTLGLLHDIGKLLINHGCGDRYKEVFNIVETERVSINRAEDKTFGFDHANAGATMLEQWGFPQEIIIPIRHQYHPEKAPEFKELTGALHVANWGAAVIGCNDGRDALALEMRHAPFEISERELELAIIEAQTQLHTVKKTISDSLK